MLAPVSSKNAFITVLNANTVRDVLCLMSSKLYATSRAGQDNLSPFKMHDFRLLSGQADNQLAGYADFGLSRQMRPKYVIN